MVSEIRTITISVGANASAKYSVSFEKDLKIEKVIATERAAQDISNVHLTIDVDGTYLIRPSVPATQLGANYQTGMPLAFEVKKGSTLTISVTNNLSSAITLDVALLIQ